MERLAENGGSQLVRLAHDSLALGLEPAARDEESRACSRYPVDEAVEPRGRWIGRRDARRRGKLGCKLSSTGVEAADFVLGGCFLLRQLLLARSQLRAPLVSETDLGSRIRLAPASRRLRIVTAGLLDGLLRRRELGLRGLEVASGCGPCELHLLAIARQALKKVPNPLRARRDLADVPIQFVQEDKLLGQRRVAALELVDELEDPVHGSTLT